MSAPDELVLFNGTVRTLGNAGEGASAIAFAGGRVAAVGRSEVLLADRSPGARAIDLDGATVVPGFNDSHNHMLETGVQLGRLDLSCARDLNGVLDAVRRACDAAPPGAWIVGSASWHESRLRERRLPTSRELDRVAPRHPVFLPRGGHVAVANSAALAAAGISVDASDPPNGHYGRDAEGRLDGSIYEDGALAPLLESIPRPDGPELDEALDRVQRAYFAAGITSVRDPWMAPEHVRAYHRARSAGSLALRSSLLLALEPGDGSAIAADLEAWPVAAGLGDEVLRIGGLKLVLDGGIEGAALRDPYAGRPDYHGHLYWDEDALAHVLGAAADFRWSVGMHVVGDDALDQALRVATAVAGAHDLGRLRWVIEHAFLADDAQLHALREAGLGVTVQLPLLYELGDNVERFWGQARAARAVPVRALLDAGIRVAAGSDSYVAPYQPLLGMGAAVTRRTSTGRILGGDQAITPLEALRAGTVAGAWLTFEEHLKGTLDPGRLADAVVLATDPLATDPEAIGDIDVLATFVGGRCVHDATGVWSGDEAGQRQPAAAITGQRDAKRRPTRATTSGATRSTSA